MVELGLVENIICILQKCRKDKDLASAKNLHKQICSKGLEVHKTVGNYLVPMFVECGSLDDAQQVFNRLIFRNEYSWASLISGYIECGQSDHALDLYQKMQEDNVNPSSFTFVPLLKACATLKDVERGQEIHVHIAQKELENDPAVGTSLVNMYAKCGSLSEAQVVFEKLPVQQVVSWTALIAGYEEYGPFQEALNCFEQMQLEGISPNVATFVCVLKACSSIGVIEKGQEMQTEIMRKSFERYPFVASALVSMYAKCGSLTEACLVFDKLPVRDAVLWNTLIAGYAEYGLAQQAVKCFDQMQLEGLFPDAATFVSTLKACGIVGTIDKGKEIHRDIVQKGIETNLFVASALIGFYCQCGSLLQAHDVLTKLPACDVVSWNTLIAGYGEYGPSHQVLKCYEQMQLEGVFPNAVTFVCILKVLGNRGAKEKVWEIHTDITLRGFERYPLVSNTLVDTYVKCASLLEAQEIFENILVRDVVAWNALLAGCAEHEPFQKTLSFLKEMELEGASPTAATFVCILKACGNKGAINKGREIHIEITRKGFESDLFVGNTLVYMYAKCGSPPEAWEIFTKLTIQEVVSWTALIAGYVKHGLAQESLRCFEQMQWEGVSPNAVTYVSVLKACSNIGTIEKGREVHMEVVQNGIERDLVVGSSLVGMYGECGLVSEAEDVFGKLPSQDIVSWNAMIEGYALNHEEFMALQCFEDLQEQGMRPNSATFTCVLSACSHAGLIFKAKVYFKEMRDEYNISPTIDHYACMVDLFARSGYLYEAEKFLDATSCPLSLGAWRALLSGCKTYGEADLGLRCFQHLVHMSPEDASPYMLMVGTGHLCEC